ESLEQRSPSEHLQLESMDPEARFQWTLGAAYLHSHYQEVQDLVTQAFGEGGIDVRLHENLGTTQIAAFGQSDIKLGDQLTATLGIGIERWSFDSSSQLASRVCCGGQPVYFATRDDATATAPRVGLSYRSASGRLYYASVAKGYRVGGYNLPLGTACGTPSPV